MLPLYRLELLPVKLPTSQTTIVIIYTTVFTRSPAVAEGPRDALSVEI